MTRWIVAMLPAMLACQTLQPKASPAPGVGARFGAARLLTLPQLSDAEKQPKADARLAMAGVHRKLAADALKKGKWHTMPDGTKLWRMAVTSPGAKALRLHFTQVDMASGKLWLHSEGKSWGPYSAKGPMDNGDFWADIVPGETITIEYQPAGKSKTLGFRIPELSHLFQE